MADRGERHATFIGIGAQKAASTWLQTVLAQIPGVVTSDPKELNFFSAEFDRGYEWYERHFARAGPSVHRGEVSPNYFVDADAPARAKAYRADMRLFVTLRDPVDRAFSNHLHEVRAGHVSGANLDFDHALARNNPLYLEQGRYAHHLARWLEHFDRDQCLVLFQEEVRADGLREARRVAAFLGLALPDGFVDRRANESLDYRSRAIGLAFWRMGNLARRHGLDRAVETSKRLPVVRALRAMNLKPVRAEVAPMAPETEARLVAFYREEVAALEALLGRKVPWPRFARREPSAPGRVSLPPSPSGPPESARDPEPRAPSADP